MNPLGRPGRRLRRAAALLLGLLAAPAAARAQEAGLTVLELVVIDGATTRPVAGARVVVARVGTALTDSGGLARFAPPRPEGVAVEIQALGYDTRAMTIDLPPGQTFQLTVPLEILPVYLPGMRVDASRERELRSRELQDFYRRARVGTGRYVTRADIERRHVRDLDELLRTLPGFAILTTPAGNKPVLDSKTTASAESFEREADCPIQYFLDGSPIQPIHDGVLSAEVELGEIEGIEIYRRGSSVPAKFHRLNNSCGVVLIWKRERR